MTDQRGQRRYRGAHPQIRRWLSEGLLPPSRPHRTLRGDIDHVLLSAAVSGANGKSYSFEEPGNRISVGSSHSVPDLIDVPAQPLLARHQDLTLPENATRLQAEIHRRFEAAGAVNAG